MKTTQALLISFVFVLLSCTEKKKTTDLETINPITVLKVPVSQKITNGSVLKIVDEMVRKEMIETYKKEEFGKLSRVESDSDIWYHSEEIIGAVNSSINKKDLIEADFNNDGSEDVLVPVLTSSGQVEYTIYYLFFKSSNIFKFIDTYSFSSEYKKNKNLNSRYGFGFERLSGNLLVGKSHYYLPEDASCCPSYYCVEKYGYNPKNNEFEMVYQSELIKNEVSE